MILLHNEFRRYEMTKTEQINKAVSDYNAAYQLAGNAWYDSKMQRHTAEQTEALKAERETALAASKANLMTVVGDKAKGLIFRTGEYGGVSFESAAQKQARFAKARFDADYDLAER